MRVPKKRHEGHNKSPRPIDTAVMVIDHQKHIDIITPNPNLKIFINEQTSNFDIIRNLLGDGLVVGLAFTIAYLNFLTTGYFIANFQYGTKQPIYKAAYYTSLLYLLWVIHLVFGFNSAFTFIIGRAIGNKNYLAMRFIINIHLNCMIFITGIAVFYGILLLLTMYYLQKDFPDEEN